jgi:hypothetical protein
MSPDRGLRSRQITAIEETAKAYERTLLDNPLDIDVTIDLVVLYWQAMDTGTVAAEQLSPRFVELAGRRLFEILDDAKVRFHDRAEIAFWNNYIRWADFGEPLEAATCRSMLLQRPNFLDPALFLFMASDGDEAAAEVNELVDQCGCQGTARCQYIKSVVGGVVNRRSRMPTAD